MVKILSIIATIAGIAMSLAHFPQAYKIIKRKNSKDVSTITYTIFFIGAIIWFSYGMAINDLPIIISFSISVIGSGTVLFLIRKYKNI